MQTQNGVLQKDDNGYPVMGGTSSLDNNTVINASFDPVTRRLLTDNTGGGGATIYQETPSGLINSSNKIYTVAHTVTTVINFAINGQYIHPAEYSAVGTTITFVTALDSSLSGTGFTITYS